MLAVSRGPSRREACAIRRIDPPSDGAVRRARQDCNDGDGGSGSGLFDEAGRLVAMPSASLPMNRRHAFAIEFHHGSALLSEGRVLQALRAEAPRPGPGRVRYPPAPGVGPRRMVGRISVTASA